MPPDTTGVFRLPPFSVPDGFPVPSATQEETTMEEFVKKNAENSNADRKQKAQPHFPDGITEAMVYDEQTERTIIWQVRQMVRGGLFAEHEGDDIAQKMRLAIWHRIGSFDASKGCELHSFITRVIMDKASNLRRARCRKLAREPEIISLETPVGNDGAVIGDLLSDEDLRSAYSGCGDREVLEKRVAEFLDSLSPKDRAICRAVMAGKGREDTGRAAGCSRRTVLNRLNGRILRKAMEMKLDRGIGEGGAL